MDLLDSVPAFVTSLEASLFALGIDVSTLFLDHVCYRVSTEAEFVQVSAQFALLGKLLSHTLVGGRSISVFKLHSPVTVGSRQISVVELPSPKLGSPYPTGWEHAEFVLYAHQTLPAFVSAHSHLPWDFAGFSKDINADVRLELPGRVSVKFHLQSLEDVIRAESRT